MVATTAFVLGFVVVALSVLFVAMRGGAKTTRDSAHPESPAARRFTSSGIALACALFGIAIPAVILIGNNTARSDNGPGGVKLSDAQKSGRQLFAHNCATCHTLKGANATGRVGPNLDQLRPPKSLVLNAIKVGRAQGQGQMPAQLITGGDAQDVASFIAAVAGR